MSDKDSEDQEDLGGVYDDTGREDLLKDDEISPEEEAFMAGYDSTPEEVEEAEDESYEEAFDSGKKKKKARK